MWIVLPCALFGLLIGSFLNVVIWRVPRGESLLHPASHCPECGHPIRPYDNIPVLSWLILRGRCRDCGTSISARYPLVELATGVVFGLTAAWIGPDILLVPMLWFAAACIALFLIDIDVKRLPNAIIAPSLVVVVLGLLATALLEGDLWPLWRALLCAVVMGVFYLLIALIARGGMGMGDVKLAVLLGLVLGWFGVSQAIVGGLGAFLFGSLWGVAMILAGRAGRKTALPFGPFMIVGAWFALIWGEAVGQWYSGFLGGG